MTVEPPEGIMNVPLRCGHASQCKRVMLSVAIADGTMFCHQCGSHVPVKRTREVLDVLERQGRSRSERRLQAARSERPGLRAVK